MSTNAIMIQDERPILMKTGLVHWLKIERWEKLSEILAAQAGHQFIRIPELGNIVINTAEISQTLTIEQYEDHCRVKEGQWQCAYRVWHLKKGECTCKSDYLRKERERIAKEKEREEHKPQTPEEQERSREAFRLSDEKAALNSAPGGMWRQRYVKGSRSGRSMRRSTITAWEKETGRTADVADLAIEENS